MWFVNGARFARWKAGADDFLWICGTRMYSYHPRVIIGTELLCQLVWARPSVAQLVAARPIRRVLLHASLSTEGNQIVESLIRSLTRQIICRLWWCPTVLTKYYHSCHDGGFQPSVESLHAIFFLILEAFDDVFVILDALDECAERKELLTLVDSTHTSNTGSCREGCCLRARGYLP